MYVFPSSFHLLSIKAYSNFTGKVKFLDKHIDWLIDNRGPKWQTNQVNSIKENEIMYDLIYFEIFSSI